jgi:hypothetical protein
MSREIYWDFMNLLHNLVKIEDDWCQDKLLDIKIFDCLFFMIQDCRYGKVMTMQGLDLITELLEINECYSTRF